MQEQRTIHVDLVLRFEEQTVVGVVRRRDGDERTFAGWLGLLAALERERLLETHLPESPHD